MQAALCLTPWSSKHRVLFRLWFLTSLLIPIQTGQCWNQSDTKNYYLLLVLTSALMTCGFKAHFNMHFGLNIRPWERAAVVCCLGWPVQRFTTNVNLLFLHLNVIIYNGIKWHVLLRYIFQLYQPALRSNDVL